MIVLFRVYRRYFDPIVAGTKAVELRPMSKYWLGVARGLGKRHDEDWVAMFACGRDQHCRRIVGVEENVRAVDVLGRPLSDQGVKDLGGVDPRVIAFRLGEALAWDRGRLDAARAQPL